MYMLHSMYDVFSVELSTWLETHDAKSRSAVISNKGFVINQQRSLFLQHVTKMKILQLWKHFPSIVFSKRLCITKKYVNIISSKTANCVEYINMSSR